MENGNLCADFLAVGGKVQELGEGHAHWDQPRLSVSQDLVLLWRHPQVLNPCKPSLTAEKR